MGATPDAITAGPDGNVWFDDQAGPDFKVGKITPAGQITEYPLSDNPWDLTVGIDGNLWLLQGHTTNGIDRVTPTGEVDLFTAGLLPTADIYDGTNLVSGPDGNLWFIDIGTPNAIVRADVQLPPVGHDRGGGHRDRVVGPSSRQRERPRRGEHRHDPVRDHAGARIDRGSGVRAGRGHGRGGLGDRHGAARRHRDLLPRGREQRVRDRLRDHAELHNRRQPPPRVPPATRTLHARVGNQRITITVPAATPCLGPGAQPQLKLSSTAIPGSKAAKLSFKRAAVFIDRGIKRTRPSSSRSTTTSTASG